MHAFSTASRSDGTVQPRETCSTAACALDEDARGAVRLVWDVYGERELMRVGRFVASLKAHDDGASPSRTARL